LTQALSEADYNRKMHIPDDPHICEKFYFTPQEIWFPKQQQRKGARNLICWDQWYPEAARLNGTS
jgi:predicted amidohydrolase